MKLRLLLIALLLGGCSNSFPNSSDIINRVNSTINIGSNNSSSSIFSTLTSSNNVEESTSTNNSSSSSITLTSEITTTSTNASTSTIFSSNTSSNSQSSEVSEFNVCEDKPGGKNENGSDKLPIPCNKNNKIVLGNNNQTMTSFSFIDSLPDYFRAIYGNNFNSSKNLYYSSNNGGGLKIDMGGPSEPAKGIQTAMFETNLKLEIRINIGAMFNNSKGNIVDKDLPVMVIYAFDENGKYLRKAEIEEITKNNENGTIKRYIDGSDVAYLEVRALQCAYKSSQGYNFALLGLDLIAWPYPLD